MTEIQEIDRSLRQAHLLRRVGAIGLVISLILCGIPFRKVATGEFVLFQNLFKFFYPVVLVAVSQIVLGKAKRLTRKVHATVVREINRLIREGAKDLAQLRQLQDRWFALAMAEWRTRFVQWIGYVMVALVITGLGVWFIARGFLVLDAFTLLLMVPVGLAYVLPAFVFVPGKRPQPLRRR